MKIYTIIWKNKKLLKNIRILKGKKIFNDRLNNRNCSAGKGRASLYKLKQAESQIVDWNEEYHNSKNIILWHPRGDLI